MSLLRIDDRSNKHYTIFIIHICIYPFYKLYNFYGRMAERFNALVLKTRVANNYRGFESLSFRHFGSMAQRQLQGTVNPPPSGYIGSSPIAPTILRTSDGTADMKVLEAFAARRTGSSPV